ncbi:phosphatase PAP2 family protein [Sneathiella glossodoripedis]|uniref:phosphatase PAP2 family protein n=1 Tax=Sneathiella glossodoripedis TaxID=418853 RepID=UPI000471301C|nr:phosphatase PAP2 family protein [Sneathiella glossodoripedis]
MFEQLVAIDIEALKLFASIRNPVLDVIFRIATELGHETFLLMFGAFGYWFLDKNIFRRAILMLLVSALANSILKEYFALPRPTVTATYTAEGYSFPSGHAQAAAAFWGWLAFEIRKHHKWAIALVCVSLLVALSRPYLGVHHFHDITVGLLLGYLQVLVGTRLFSVGKIQPYFWRWTSALLVSIGVTVICASYFTHPEMKKLALIVAAFLTALLLGTLYEQQFINFEPPRTILGCILTLVIGLVILLLVWRGLKPVFSLTGFEGYTADYIRYLLTGFWLSTGMPFVINRYLNKKNN